MFDCVAPCLLKTQQIFQPGGGYCTWCCIDGSDMIVLLGVQWCSLLFIFTVCIMYLSFVPTYHIVALAIKMRLQTQNLACKFRKGSVGGWASHSFARLAVLDFYAHVLLEHSPQVCLMKTMSKCILDTDMFWGKIADKLPKTLQFRRSLIFTTETTHEIFVKKRSVQFFEGPMCKTSTFFGSFVMSLNAWGTATRWCGQSVVRCQQMAASRL